MNLHYRFIGFRQRVSVSRAYRLKMLNGKSWNTEPSSYCFLLHKKSAKRLFSSLQVIIIGPITGPLIPRDRKEASVEYTIPKTKNGFSELIFLQFPPIVCDSYPVQGSRSTGTIEKVSGRRGGTEIEKETSPFLPQIGSRSSLIPLVARPLFWSSPLTENVEKAF